MLWGDLKKKSGRHKRYRGKKAVGCVLIECKSASTQKDESAQLICAMC